MHFGQSTSPPFESGDIAHAETLLPIAPPPPKHYRQTMTGINPPPSKNMPTPPSSLRRQTMLGLLDRIPLPPVQQTNTPGAENKIPPPSSSTPHSTRRTAMSSQKPPPPVRGILANERIRVKPQWRPDSEEIAQKILRTAHQPTPQTPSTTPPPYSGARRDLEDEAPTLLHKGSLRPPSIDEVNCEDQVPTLLQTIPEAPIPASVRPLPPPAPTRMRTVSPPPISTRAPMRSTSTPSLHGMPNFGALPDLNEGQLLEVQDAEATFSSVLDPEEILKLATLVATKNDMDVMRHILELVKELYAKTPPEKQKIREGLLRAIGRIEGRLLSLSRQPPPPRVVSRQSVSGLLAVEPPSQRHPTPSTNPRNSSMKHADDSETKIKNAGYAALFIGHILLGVIGYVSTGKEVNTLVAVTIPVTLSIMSAWYEKTKGKIKPTWKHLYFITVAVCFMIMLVKIHVLK